MAHEVGAAVELLQHFFDLREDLPVVRIGAKKAKRVMKSEDVPRALETGSASATSNSRFLTAAPAPYRTRVRSRSATTRWGLGGDDAHQSSRDQLPPSWGHSAHDTSTEPQPMVKSMTVSLSRRLTRPYFPDDAPGEPGARADSQLQAWVPMAAAS
jgi:hypothetical protein